MIGSIIIAFSMYSKIPMPRLDWTEERMKYAMCFFPLVGLVTGGVLYFVTEYLRWTGSEEFLTACVGTSIPLLITGGIHMDGFLDVTDARASYESRERKLEILKDPHAGAFAIIRCSMYLLLYAGFFSRLTGKGMLLFAGTFPLTRALSGLAVVTFPMAKSSGLAATFSSQAQKRAVILSMAGFIALSVGYLLDISVVSGLLCAAAGGITFLWYYRMSKKEFGGITGDLAGYFLQISELVFLITIVVSTWE